MEIMACPTACDSPGKQLERIDVVIDVPLVMEPEVVIDVPLVMEPALWPECCIYLVPKKLREVNEKAYTPKFVSIGPFHHGRKELSDMEMYKLRYFKDFLYRTKKCQEDFRNIIAEIEVQIRHFYSESCRLNSKDFVKMILLDAIFIIELFLKEKEENAERKEEEGGGKAKRKEEEEKAKRKKEDEEEDCKKKSDHILSQPWLQIGILHDLILLENQLPFFVLEKLYRFAFNEYPSSYNHCDQEGKQIKEEYSPFVELSRNYFRRYDQQQPHTPTVGEVKHFTHFTDLLRYFFRQSKKYKEEWKKSKDLMEKRSSAERGLDTRFCATKLDDAGLKFKVVKADHERRGLLDISSAPGCVRGFLCINAFRRSSRFDALRCFRFIACLPCMICLPCFPCLFRIQRTLEVPQLVIDEDTETIFRNLVALEQCHYPSKAYICSYVQLLDRLVDTKKDVNLLVDKEVISNQLGSNAEVASLINKLSNQIVATTSSYDRIVLAINQHYDLPLNHMLATLNREYFPNIFRGTATVVGLIVLGFTFWNFLRPFVL